MTGDFLNGFILKYSKYAFRGEASVHTDTEVGVLLHTVAALLWRSGLTARSYKAESSGHEVLRYLS